MIHFVIGTRAQLFKMAPIMIECQRQGLQWRWIYTAQHKETIKPTLDTFGLPKPHFTVVHWNTEAKTIAKMLQWLIHMFFSFFKSNLILDGFVGQNHVVLTHGDTFTTWFGALYGKFTRTKVMHVESGLRSFNLMRPFPEEINRLITFALSDYYACPGDWAVDNLKKYKGEKLNTFQNTQLDTVRFGSVHFNTANIEIPSCPYVVVSVHRYENIFNKNRFEKVITEIEGLSKDFHMLFVQHPATLVQLDKLNFRERMESNEKISMLPRLEYLDFLKLIMSCEFVITDGGGNQEELFHLGIPTLIFRDETERNEGLGVTAIISKLDTQIIKQFSLEYKNYRRAPLIEQVSPSRIIVDFLGARQHGV